VDWRGPFWSSSMVSLLCPGRRAHLSRWDRKGRPLLIRELSFAGDNAKSTTRGPYKAARCAQRKGNGIPMGCT
ncbi:unnamed protein product, partial [Heterosigma akashiwo]